MTEGRRSFLKRVAGIESGAECERLAPLISKVADGEADPDEMRTVRPHLKSCLACKATLREYRAAPARLAGLVPPVVALAGGGGKVGLLARLMDRLAGVGDAAGAKVAAVAAAGVVLAGGSAAGIDALHHDAPPVPASAFGRAADPKPAPETVAAAPDPAPTPAASAPDPSSAAIEAVQNPAPGSTPTKATPDPAPEFDPGSAAGTSNGSSAPSPPEFGSPSGSAAPVPHASAPSPEPGSGSAEFGP